MTRQQKLNLNISSSLIHQLTALVCGIILPKFFIGHFGSEVNGLITSITQFISIISFMELGVGAVVQASLYRPLAQKDYNQISAIVVTSNNFFRRLGKILVVYVSVLVFVYPLLINKSFSFLFTSSLLLIIAFSSFVQYYFSITNQLLLNADQLSFIVLITNTIFTLLNTFAIIELIRLDYSIHTVKSISALLFLIKPIVFNVVVKNRYPINRKIEITNDPIPQKWNGVAQHIAAIAVTGTDVVVLTMFSALTFVSVYSIYSMITGGMTQIVVSTTSSLLPYFGNMLVNNETERLKRVFERYQWFIHTLVVTLFTLTGLLIIPFVSIYTAVITDFNYIYPAFGVILTVAQALFCLRMPYTQVVLAAGHFKQTQSSAIIEASLNVIISIVLVRRFGLVGVAIGTAIAMGYRTVYLAVYVSKNILYINLKRFVLHLGVDLLSVILMVLFTQSIIVHVSSYVEWIIMAIKASVVCLIIALAVNSVFFPKLLYRRFLNQAP